MSRGYTATTTESVKNSKKKLQKFLRTLDTVPDEEVSRTAQAIKAKAIAQVPYKTGKLESSVYVRVSKARSRVGIVAGASARSPEGYNYAGIQHEDTSFHHPIKGKAHYISDPFDQEVYNMIRRIRRKLRYKNGSR